MLALICDLFAALFFLSIARSSCCRIERVMACSFLATALFFLGLDLWKLLR